MIVNVDKASLEAKIKEEDIVLVDLWAPWCGPCKQLGKTLDQLDTEGLGVTIAKCNVDENPDVAADYGIMGVPALFFYKNGEKVKSASGLQSLEDLKGTIAEISK